MLSKRSVKRHRQQSIRRLKAATLGATPFDRWCRKVARFARSIQQTKTGARSPLRLNLWL
jgi:hypothetical protein